MSIYLKHPPLVMYEGWEKVLGPTKKELSDMDEILHIYACAF